MKKSRKVKPSKSLYVLVNRLTNLTIFTPFKSVIANRLQCSVDTISYKYSSTGTYDIGHWILYTNVEQGVIEGLVKSYNRTVVPPSKRVVEPIVSISPVIDIIEEYHDHEDWRYIEKSLAISEYDAYYSKRTLKELEASKKYFLNDSIRMRYINKYGELRQQE